MLPTPSSSWTTYVTGHVTRAGRKPPVSRAAFPVTDIVCATCGRPFRGAGNRLSCSSRCAEARSSGPKKPYLTAYQRRRRAGLCCEAGCETRSTGARCEFHRILFQAARPQQTRKATR